MARVFSVEQLDRQQAERGQQVDREQAMRAQQEHATVQRYRNWFVQSPIVRSLAFARPGESSGDPEATGKTVIALLDAQAELEARAMGDRFLTVEGREAIHTALLEEVRAALGRIKNLVTEGIEERRAALYPAPELTETAKLARQIELQRAEARLAQLAAHAVQASDIIARSDAAMLDAIEAAPDVYISNNDTPMHLVRELIKERRYELADPGQRAMFDKLQKLERQQYRFDTLLAHADNEATGATGDSGIRPASVWVA